MSIRKLNVHQRTVLVAGLAFALYWLGRWIILSGSTNGWIAYAPLSGSSLPSGAPFLTSHLWAQLLIWLGLVLVWVACALFIFRSAPKTDEETEAPN